MYINYNVMVTVCVSPQGVGVCGAARVSGAGQWHDARGSPGHDRITIRHFSASGGRTRRPAGCVAAAAPAGGRPAASVVQRWTRRSSRCQTQQSSQIEPLRRYTATPPRPPRSGFPHAARSKKFPRRGLGGALSGAF